MGSLEWVTGRTEGLPGLFAVSVAILFMVRGSLGVGYAFWVGAVLLGFSQRQDLEAVVNHLSMGSHTRAALETVGLVLSVSVLAACLARARVEERWRAWVLAQTGEGRFPRRSCRLLQEAGGLFLARPGGAFDGAGEARERSAGARFGAWLLPAAELASPVSPAFLATCALLGLSLGRGWLLFFALFVAAAAVGAWSRSGVSEDPFPDSPPVSPSAVAWGWAALPVLALWGGRGILAGTLVCLALVAGSRTGLSLMGFARFAWEAISMDRIVLVVGVLAYGAMVEGTGLLEVLGASPCVAGLPPAWGLAGVFALAALLAGVASRPLVGVGLVWPWARALSGGAGMAPEWAVALAGGAILGGSVGLGGADKDLEWERPPLWLALPAAGALGLASLLPGALKNLAER